MRSGTIRFVYLIFRRSSIDWLGVREPIVQRKYTKTGPEAIGSLFIGYRSPMIQVNKSSELRIDLKTVEPSYTSVRLLIEEQDRRRAEFLDD